MYKANVFAFDRSARRIDADGRLHVDKSHISRACVNPYYGKEIPGFVELGLDSGKVYQLFRDPAELEKAAPTFANLPILKSHVLISAEKPRADLVVGTIGSKVDFEAPYLCADLCIWDAEAIAGVESDKMRELSCAYRYVPIMEPGEFDGKRYDGRMTNIQGNHLALAETGRAGSDVVVADSNPFPKVEHMKMTKLGHALYVALSAASPKLAQDAALGSVVGMARRKGLDPKAIKDRLIAMDAEMSPEKMDDIIDAVIGVNDNPEPAKDEEKPGLEAAEKSPDALKPDKSEDDKQAEDDGGAAKVHELLDGKVDKAVVDAICAMLAPKKAEDEAPAKGKEGESVKREDMKGAMDSFEKRLREQFKALETAKEQVREVVGSVSGVDTAAEVYGFALDHMSVEHEGITDAKALAALCNVAMSARKPVATVAMDASTIKSVPGLDRFGTA